MYADPFTRVVCLYRLAFRLVTNSCFARTSGNVTVLDYVVEGESKIAISHSFRSVVIREI
jgi:hypothetical protein